MEQIDNIDDIKEEIETIKDDVIKEIDPNAFLEGFKGSSYYRDAFNEFYKGKNISPEEMESDQEELEELFEGGDSARRSLILYSEETKQILKYNPDKYSEGFKEHFKEYEGMMKDIKKGRVGNYNGSLDKDSIIAMEYIRSNLHNSSAREIVKQGLTKSNKIARGLIELMVIEKGLDTFENSQISESDKLRFQLTGVPETY